MITIKNLKYSFKKTFFKRKNLEYDIDIENLEIKKGEKVGICGLNGSGKSTLIKLMSGILTQNEGEIDIMGYSPKFDRKKYVKNISVIWGQRSILWSDLTPFENFNVLSKLYSVDKNNFQCFINDSILKLGCREYLHKQVRKLSLGQRTKVEIIASLIHSPSILFYDESFIGLDFKSKHDIINYINEYVRYREATLFLISHDIDDVIKLCNEVIILDKGKLIKKDSINSIILKNQEKYVVKIRLMEGGNNNFDFLNQNEITVKCKTDSVLELQVCSSFDRSKLIKILLKNLELNSIDFNENSLEDIILELI